MRPAQRGSGTGAAWRRRIGAAPAARAPFRQAAYVLGGAADQDGSAQDAASSQRSCERVVLDRALADLDTAAARLERLAAARGPLADVTRGLAAAVFDIEWEHAFLELRFGEHYRRLRASDLDEQRMRFYRLALYLSLIAGPLRLLDGDYPDREPMLEIVEANITRALALL